MAKLQSQLSIEKLRADFSHHTKENLYRFPTLASIGMITSRWKLDY